MQQTIDNQNDEILTLEATIADQNNEINDLKSFIVQLQQTIGEKDEEINGLQQTIANQKDQINEMQNRIDDCEEFFNGNAKIKKIRVKTSTNDWCDCDFCSISMWIYGPKVRAYHNIQCRQKRIRSFSWRTFQGLDHLTCIVFT